MYLPRLAALLQRARWYKASPARRQILVASVPCLQRVILQRAAIGKTDLPRLRTGQPVDCVQMDRRRPIVLSARQEHDARHRRRNVATQNAQCGGGDFLNRRLDAASPCRR